MFAVTSQGCSIPTSFCASTAARFPPRIVEIDLLADPDRLRELDLTAVDD
jgi:hypothetical protein